MKKLLVVESPTKARTLKRILGREFDVLATKGHIMDLPKNKSGEDIERGFEPRYTLLPGKKKLIAEIQKTARESGEVFIGSDPDREGEAIAYHIAQKVQEKADTPLHRVLFFEITREEVLKALAEPGSIDMKKVSAQMARRILDRLVGYQVSPLLWKSVHRGLSAGRVQTVALRLVCEREKEINSHIPKKFWTLLIEVEKDGVRFTAKLRRWRGKALQRIEDEKLAREIQNSLKGKEALVMNLEERKKKIPPPPPFKTSTLQQEASNRWGFSPKKTMMLAQQLYEGVDLPEGRVGLITYMRTDSIRMAEKAIKQARKLIEESYSRDYLPKKPRVYRDKKTVQGAHEAIRPTDFKRRPEKISIQKALLKLYELIWKRALASQTSDALQAIEIAGITVGEAEFEAQGRTLIFDGFFKVLGSPPKDEVLPRLEKGETLKLLRTVLEEHETEPPPRYTEASLIKTLEAKGVGRPSTYAPMVSTLYDRKYVVKRNRILKPTELGMLVFDILIPRFPKLFEIKFTAEMEKELDEVENGEKDWRQILQAFYSWFSPIVEKVKEEVKEIKKATVEETGEICPLCGSSLVVKWGRYGKFLACSAWPECKYTRPLNQEIREDIRCPICGKAMVVRTGKTGRFLACLDYPSCKGTRPLSTGILCPECGKGELIERRSKKGRVFYACSEYPTCQFTLPFPPVQVTCPSCGYPLLIEVPRRGENVLRCPKCKKIFRGETLPKD